jgi:hypothetical protein
MRLFQYQESQRLQRKAHDTHQAHGHGGVAD